MSENGDYSEIVLTILRSPFKALRVQRGVWNGNPFVQVREWVRPDPLGEWTPGREGAFLHHRELSILIETLQRIERAGPPIPKAMPPETPKPTSRASGPSPSNRMPALNPAEEEAAIERARRQLIEVGL